MGQENLRKDKMNFLERNFEIHGEFEGKVYRRKRNGEWEKYAYEPQSHYRRTPLVIRNENIRKAISGISNPNNSDYSDLVRKVNYYTPYIVPPGDWKFMGETVFYVRERGEYTLHWQGTGVAEKRTISKRTAVKFSFLSEGSFHLDCYFDEELYCEREFIVTTRDLDESYQGWLEEHLSEILQKPEVEYEELKLYRRGMCSKRNWLLGVSGKCKLEILYPLPIQKKGSRARENPWLYHRKDYDHRYNIQSRSFNLRMKNIGQLWQNLSEKEKAEWEEKAETLYRLRGSKLKHSRLTGFNLFTSSVIAESR